VFELLKRDLPRWSRRVVLIWAIETLGLILMAQFLPGLTINHWYTAILAIAVIGLLNGLMWPALMALALPITVLTLGLGTVVFNALVVGLAARLVPGMSISGIWTHLLVALGLAAINTLFTTLLGIDEDYSYYRNVIRRLARQSKEIEDKAKPGVLFLEIDGLAEPILRRAIQEGYAPTLARWLERGSHRLIGWECNGSSQTSTSQAGILHGNIFDVIAFRYYEKDTKQLMICSYPQVAAKIEQQVSNGQGLLSQGGASRSNLLSGDASNTMLTVSTILEGSRLHPWDFYYYFVNPYNFSRMVLLMIWEIIVEIFSALQQWIQDVRPRITPPFYYPLLRAVTTITLRELTVYRLMADIFEGVPVVYSTFAGYDEVAHFSGIDRPTTLNVLHKIDQQLARLESAAALAPRPYYFVILSDHGQSQGPTFDQQYGLSLEDLVRKLIAGELTVAGSSQAGESWTYLNTALTEAIQSNRRASRLLRRTLRRRTFDGSVVLGPEHRQFKPGQVEPEIMVTYSGSIGLIYFTGWAERLSFESISELFPEVIPGLSQHPGVGFIMVRSERRGPMAIGPRGICYLANERVEGQNPLADYGPNAVLHLLELDRYPHTPDILVNSVYDPVTGQASAYENIVGTHGGLGGTQMAPFLLFPANWELKNEKIIGAVALHKLLKGWLDDLWSDRPVTSPLQRSAIE